MATTGSFKDVIALSDGASTKFAKAVQTSEKKILSEVVTMLKDLEITKAGNIATTSDNLKKMMTIRTKLYKLANNKEYLAAVKDLISSFDEIYKKQIGILALKDKIGRGDEKYKLTKEIAVENTIQALSGDGLAANVTGKLNEMLLTAVTTGAKFSDLQGQLYEYLADTDGGDGALTRYANTWSVTALSQYSGQINKLATDDLDYAWYMYAGSTIETTREFCQHVTKKKYVHVSELGDLLRGRIEYDGEVHECGIYAKTGLPFGMIEGTTVDNLQVNCGGWNCRHQLYPIADEAVPQALRDAIQSKLDDMVHEVDLGPYKDRIQAVQDYVNTHKSAKVSKYLFDALEAAKKGDKYGLEQNLASAEKTIEINEASIRSKAKKREEAKADDFKRWHKDHDVEYRAIKEDVKRCDVASYVLILETGGNTYDAYQKAFDEIVELIKIAKSSHRFVYSMLSSTIDSAEADGYVELAKEARKHLSTFDSYTSNDERKEKTRDMSDTNAKLRTMIEEAKKAAAEMRKTVEKAKELMDKFGKLVDEKEIKRAIKKGDAVELKKIIDGYADLETKVGTLSHLADPAKELADFKYEDLLAAEKAITAKMATFPATDYASRAAKCKIEFEYLERTQKYSTWKVAADAYRKEYDRCMAMAKFTSVEKTMESAVAYSATSSDKKLSKLILDARDAIAAGDVDKATKFATEADARFRELSAKDTEKMYKNAAKNRKAQKTARETLEDIKKRMGADFPNTLRGLDDAIKAWESGGHVSDEARKNAADIEKVMREIFDKHDFGMNVETGLLDQILSSWFKNTFEVGGGNGYVGSRKTTGKIETSHHRLSAAHKMFGIGKNLADDQLKRIEYEKYGNLLDHDILRSITHNTASMYGDVEVRFKKDMVVPTWTFCDSLGGSSQPSLCSDPRAATYDSRDYLLPKKGTQTDNLVEFKKSHISSYLELQYHGMLTPECVESLTFDRDITREPSTIATARKWMALGVKVYYVVKTQTGDKILLELK